MCSLQDTDNVSLTQSSPDIITPDEMKELFAAMWYFSLLSVAGCIFNALTTFFLKISNQGIGKMVLSISLMDFIFSISFIFTVIQIPAPILCDIGSFFWGVGFTGSLWWSCCFAHCLFYSVKYETNDTPDNFIRKYWIIAAFISIISGSSAAVLKGWSLDKSTGICFHPINMAEKLADDWAISIIFVTPLVAAVGYCSVCYIVLIKELRKTNSRKFIELIIYPLILIVCAFPILTQRTYHFFCRDCEKLYWLYWLTTALFRCQGLFNAFAFGLSKRILEGFKVKCARKTKNMKKQDLYQTLSSAISGDYEGEEEDDARKLSLPSFVKVSPTREFTPSL